MGRQPEGKVSQTSSDTLLFAFIAARLEGLRNSGAIEKWAARLGIRLSGELIRKRPDASERLGGRQAEAVLRPSLAIDWSALQFFVAVVELRWATEDRQLRQIAAINGVVDVYALEGGDRLLTRVVYERLPEKKALEGQLSEFCKIASWSVVAEEGLDASPSTARWLAIVASERESLRRDS